jgi:putative colanic acid biosynthesis UDP-glucose lipid carrier transferase
VLVNTYLTSNLYRNSIKRNAVIVGVSSLGIQLRNKMGQDLELALQFKGFFDDRALDRLAIEAEHQTQLIGGISELSKFVHDNAIDIIYIALPMTSQPRVLDLLDILKDTTVSIYFVPDIFVFDLIQARIDDVAGIPVVAVCETPFSGLSGGIKRLSDIVLSIIILILISPIILAVAIGVKLSSKGPVLFKQRRYGLDAEEISVYKFRSMTVTENGGTVTQATKDDNRITRFGKFIRRTSLDELPQFVNVLQGRMSIVGPRPHAVAHNEMYRKLIKGYMIRHKVKPGITGWAQVNGLRGETETVDKMEARIEYDLEYLRQWSLSLDLQIIARTVLLVFKDRNAY